jgi:Sec-independent protein translocase protein TatA
LTEVAYDAAMDIAVVLVIVLIIVAIWRGPKVLPEWGAAIGKTVREARSHATKGLGDGDDADSKALSEGSDGEPVSVGTSATSTTASRPDTTGAPRS